MQVGNFLSDLHTKRSPTQSDIYQMLYWYNWFSWWWARGCSKHVENWNKWVEKNFASSWSFTKKSEKFIICDIREIGHPWFFLIGCPHAYCVCVCVCVCVFYCFLRSHRDVIMFTVLALPMQLLAKYMKSLINGSTQIVTVCNVGVPNMEFVKTIWYLLIFNLNVIKQFIAKDSSFCHPRGLFELVPY